MPSNNLDSSNPVRLLTNAQSESKNVPKDWQTHAEKTGYRVTPRYKETIEFSKKLADASPLIEYRSFGKSGEGRDLPLLITSNHKTFSVEAARKKAKGKNLRIIKALAIL